MEAWEELQFKRQHPDPCECPAGVVDGVEDQVVRRDAIVKYGVISSGTKTVFWAWLTGGGLIHVWTGSKSMDIATIQC